MSSAQSTVQRIESAFDAIEAHLRQPGRDLLWHRRLGALLRGTNPADNHAANYGRKWLAAVHRRTGLKRELVYKTMQLAGLCSAAEAARWNGRVRWSRLIPVLSVADEATRTTILTDALRRKWGCRQVSAAVGRHNRHRPPSGGRPRRRPVSKGPARDAAALATALGGVRALITAIILPPGGVLEELLGRQSPLPERLRKKLRLALDRAKRLRPDLEAAIAQLTTILERDTARSRTRRPSAGA